MSDQPLLIQANREIGDRGIIHLYRPEVGQLHPFVLAIHGGAWKTGDQTSYEFLWPKVKPLGFALALVSYRVAPVDRFPRAYDDLLKILRWLKEHGASSRLDVSNCVVFGASAGGHLAMLLATRAIKEDQPRPIIRGVAEYCGVMDLVDQYAFDRQRGSTITEDFLGTTPEQDPGAYRDASPIHHIHAKMPPVWMAHGTADEVVPIAQSRAMARQLAQAGCAPIFLEAAGRPHTLCELTEDHRAVEPFTLLFEQDILRFFQRSILG